MVAAKIKHDIVYFVKESPTNEELRYSLRSVEANWEYRDVWFYGGCPDGFCPDRRITLKQHGSSKFEKVRNMVWEACSNDELSEDIWLFNDDFFILKPMAKPFLPQYDGTLFERIVDIEERYGRMVTHYTKLLRDLTNTLKKSDKDCLNYAVHKPMLINRQKMLEVLDKFPNCPMFRALYGNYWAIGGEDKPDMKIAVNSYENLDEVEQEWEFLSTSDDRSLALLLATLFH